MNMIPSWARDFVISPRCFFPSILSSSILIPPMFLTFLFLYSHFSSSLDIFYLMVITERIPPNTAIIILFSPHSFLSTLHFREVPILLLLLLTTPLLCFNGWVVGISDE
ncbi:hypothetical protein P168DRAFT_127673 [Aspergillus campestris IBT 28561]|uniref:Uncharacterized protein n=1 Tax=Aspergillus campestris (strain IBT 28561) TaxID=1392248 RepID=A0A2I1D6W5_ASPC2|nr:uncharacterized protein P168DRAFT_127673 [Aspergillus campestris IBT 28561]PKY05622.1 hypothetical protein P168DRAFT_127673 [Aspergillus campestris IBT 28561]